MIATRTALTRLTSAALITSSAACGMMPGSERMAAPNVPAAVAAPSGHKPVMTLKGVGALTYECRAGASGAPEWAFVAPDAMLQDRSGKQVGKYYGGPTWEHSDGSKVMGKQLAVAPAAQGSIPFQLVEAGGASGSGSTFRDVTYIQRVNTMGGVAPKTPCDTASMNRREIVNYSADYVFYKR